jgi:hypothetical protein
LLKVEMKKSKSPKLTPRKIPTRLNEYTGKPRKFICYHNLHADGIIKIGEAMSVFNTPREGYRYDIIPLDICQKLVKSLELYAGGLRMSIGRRNPLTESETRYCELEGIDQAEFLGRKSDATAKK